MLLLGKLNNAATLLGELRKEVMVPNISSADIGNHGHDHKKRRLSESSKVQEAENHIGADDSVSEDEDEAGKNGTEDLNELEQLKYELAQAKAEIHKMHTLATKFASLLHEEVVVSKEKEVATAKCLKETEYELKQLKTVKIAELKAECTNASTERDLLREDNLKLANERDELKMRLESAGMPEDQRRWEKLTLQGFLEECSTSNYMTRLQDSSSTFNSSMTPETHLWDYEELSVSDDNLVALR